jgi:ATP-dependent Clp protease ATP-binding subunit ClpA
VLGEGAVGKFHKPGFELSVLLFDEIEKSSDVMWQLLLGVLDKAMLTLGDNRTVNFQKVIIIMTSNLGAKDLAKMSTDRGIGYHSGIVEVDHSKANDIAVQAATRHFTPEFMNRINNLVVFHTLTKEDIRKIMQIELGFIQKVMLERANFVYQVTDTAKDKLIEEGYIEIYGARNLKRAIESRVRLPLSRLVSSGQIAPGEAVLIDEVGAPQFEFSIKKDTEEIL